MSEAKKGHIKFKGLEKCKNLHHQKTLIRSDELAVLKIQGTRGTNIAKKFFLILVNQVKNNVSQYKPILYVIKLH